MNQIEHEIRVMGIDYGEKRVGIALSDPLLTFAYPYVTIQNDNYFSENLSRIIQEKNVKKIILGLPSSRFESSGRLIPNVMDLKKDLETKFNIEVILWDEEFSSVLAKDQIIESVTKKSKRKNKELLDRHSAAIILQEYLNSKK